MNEEKTANPPKRSKMFSRLLTTPTARLGRATRLLVVQIKLWSHCARTLKANRLGQQAAALAYHTIFGIVPLAIVMLLIFQSLSAYEDIGENLKQFVYEQLNLTGLKFTSPQQGERLLTEYFDEIIRNFFTGLNKRSLTLLSAALVIWAALNLLGTIERTFNYIWHVPKPRGWLHRIINYWAVLTLGPLVVGVGLYLSTHLIAIGQIEQTFASFSKVARPLLSYLVATIALFLLYFLLPNTKVQAKSAIWGAAVAALIWMFAKWGFRQYVTEFIPYSRIYGVVGLVPLSVLWIFVTWLIVLFGLQLTFTTQHLKSLDAAYIASANKSEEQFIANDLTAINVLAYIASAFERDNAPVQAEQICSRLNIPPEFGEKLLDHLVRHGLLARTTEPVEGFLLARAPANITLADIAEVLGTAALAQPRAEQPPLTQIAELQRNTLAQFTLKQLLTGSLAQPSVTAPAEQS